MAERKIALWKRVVGYLGFSAFALVAAFFLTFPYDALKDRVKLEAEAQGYLVKIGSMGPGFFTLRATDLEVSRKPTGAEGEKPPEPLKIDSISVGPAFFPPGVAISANVLGGSVYAKAGGITGVSVLLEAEDLDLSKGNLKAFSGIDFAGTVDLNLALSMPKIAVGGGPSEPDLGAASGTLSVETKGLAVKGGVVNVSAETYDKLIGLRRSPAEYAGQVELIPFDVPAVTLGDVHGGFKFEKGAGTAEEIRAKSADLEATLTGTLKLAKRVEYSEAALDFRLKPDPEWQKRLGATGAALAQIQPDPKDPNWRLGKLTGMIGQPRFR